jgi:hypothetical protein
MTERGKQLHTTADGQIAELVGLITNVDEATLGLPCQGRGKLGDGTVAASAQHTTENYERIAAFVGGVCGPVAGHHRRGYTAGTFDRDRVLQQLYGARDAVGVVVRLTEGQLDAIPPKDSFRFCDGERTLEQVIAGLLKHQGHQVDALRAAISGRT